MRIPRHANGRFISALYIGADHSTFAALQRDLAGDLLDSLSQAADLETAQQKFQQAPVDVLLLELAALPDCERDDLLAFSHQMSHASVVLLADEADAATAVHLAEASNQDYVIKNTADWRFLKRAVIGAGNQHRLQTELALINQVNRQLTSTLDLNTVLTTTLEEVRRLLDVMACSIWLVDAPSDELVCKQVVGPGSEFILEWRLDKSEGIVGWVATHGMPVLIRDTWRDPRHYTRIDETTGLPIRSMLCLPLQTKQKMLGVIQLVDSEANSFTPADQAFLESITASAAIAIENAQLYARAQAELFERAQVEEALRKRNEELARLYSASDALLSGASSLENLGDLIVNTVQHEFEQANCSLLLIEPDSEYLKRVATAGVYTNEVVQSQLMRHGSGLVPLVIRTGQPLNVADVTKEADYKSGWAQARSELAIPLKVGERVLGALDIQSAQYGAFSEADERLLLHFADRAAMALESLQLTLETQRWAKELDLLNHIIATMMVGATETEIFHTGCVELAHFLKVPYAFLGLLTDDRQKQVIAAEMGTEERPSHIGTLIPGEDSPLLHSVFHSQTPAVYSQEELQRDPALTRLFPLLSLDATPGTVLVIPIIMRGQQVVGSLLLVSPSPRSFSKSEQRLGKVVGEELGHALETVQLYEQLRTHSSELEVHVATRTEELRLANARLTQALQARDEFLASMSHELRTPLNAILLRCELVSELEPVTPSQAKSIRIIEESARHLLEMINDMLDLAKIESGKLDLVIEPVAVQSICEGSLHAVQPGAQQKQITVHQQVDETAVYVQADGRRLRQVLVNLLSNAVKFTPEGGMVGLQVRADPEHSLLHFTVWDTGIGIHKEELTRLFQPFSQIDGSLARKYSGAGLGLALVQRLIRLHHGLVHVESEMGQGSRFTVSLPWSPLDRQNARQNGKKAERSPVFQASPKIRRPTVSATILLAEDNEATTEALGEFLSLQGYEVLTARNGREALELAHQEHPDLILMDIQMPDMDGLEAIRQIRAHSATHAVAIVAITALAMDGDRERCLNAGANVYISKPLSFEYLNQVIEGLLIAS